MVVRTWKQVRNQKVTLLRRIEKTKAALKELLVKKQGKQTLENKFIIQEKIDLILQELKVADYFDIKIHRHTTIKKKRKYGDNPARTIQEVSFSLEVQVKQSEIDQAIQNLGWLIYTTNAPKQSLPRTLGELTLNDALILYKEQFQIEARFNDLKNKVTKLLPLFLKKDHRIKGLINLLMIALKITCLIEVTVAKTLKENEKTLKGLTPGNPSRKTYTPTLEIQTILKHKKPTKQNVCGLFYFLKNALKKSKVHYFSSVTFTSRIRILPLLVYQVSFSFSFLF